MDTSKLKIEYVPIGQLKPAEYNPRQMTDRQAKDLEESIRRFGLVDPIIVNQHPERLNIVVGGHQRLKIAERLGIDTVPVVYVSLNEQQEKELNLRLNKNLGEWDLDLLANFDTEMLLDVGWTDEELTEIFQTEMAGAGEGNTDPDAVPDPPVKPKAKYGDIYQLGRHRLMCGDSTKRDDVERLMGGERAEILFTSPPYFDQRTYGGDKDLSLEHIIQFIPCFEPFTIYQVINLGIVIRESEIIEYWQDYIKLAKGQGYKLLSWNIWDKLQAGHVGHQNRMFAIEHEWIFVFGKQEKKLNRTVEKQESSFEKVKSYKKDKDGKLLHLKRNKDGSIEYTPAGEVYDKKNLGTVLRQYPEMSRELTDKHPAIMRIEVPIEYINAMTNENDIVIEPFGGSGTTMVACEKTNRRCFMMELDPVYVDVCVSRWIKYMIDIGMENKIEIKLNGNNINYK